MLKNIDDSLKTSLNEMKKVFYDHLVLIEEVVTELDIHELDPNDREELIRLTDENLHHQVLNLILKELPKNKHEFFLDHFQKSPEDEKLLLYLRREIGEEIEDRIKVEAAKVKREILDEIKRTKKK